MEHLAEARRLPPVVFFAMVIGTLVIRLVIREAHSLKQKRSVLKRVKDRLRNRFNISVSEVAAQDVWQSATLGVAMVGSDKKYVYRASQPKLRRSAKWQNSENPYIFAA